LRVALLTLHRPTNFGSALQASALCRTMERAGHAVTVVDYRPERWSTHSSFRSWAAERPARPVVARLAEATSRTVEVLRARPQFDRFYASEGLEFTRRYSDCDGLRRDPPDADVYMVGSDQVWNPVYNGGTDRAFYLDFGPADVRRVAYAASFGSGGPTSGDAHEVTDLLRRFSHVSIRESGALDSLARPGVHVLDPTLLLTGSEWSTGIRAAPERPYVLTYCVEEGRRPLVGDMAVAIAGRTGLEVRNVSFGGRRRAVRGARNHLFASPGDFVTLMAHAAFVITSSFHGAAFAVNLERPFVAVPPSRFADRLLSLLRSTGLLDRLGATVGSVLDLDLEPDFGEARARLAEMRSRSLGFLDGALAP